MLYQEKKQQTDRQAAEKPNLTGIPTQMKLDYERLSGLSFDDVRVHYHSDRPAKLGALAYTQGAQVYMGPGQERHLPHELGHVIQQKLGLVRPTGTIGGIPLNDSPELERTADQPPVQRKADPQTSQAEQSPVHTGSGTQVVQRKIEYSKKTGSFVVTQVRVEIDKRKFPKQSGSDRSHTISDKDVQIYVRDFMNELLCGNVDDQKWLEVEKALVGIRGNDNDGEVNNLMGKLKSLYNDFTTNEDESCLINMANTGTALYAVVANAPGNLRHGTQSGNRSTGNYVDLDAPEVMDFKDDSQGQEITIQVSGVDARSVKSAMTLGKPQIAVKPYMGIGAVSNSSDPAFKGRRMVYSVTGVEQATRENAFGYVKARRVRK